MGTGEAFADSGGCGASGEVVPYKRRTPRKGLDVGKVAEAVVVPQEPWGQHNPR